MNAPNVSDSTLPADPINMPNEDYMEIGYQSGLQELILILKRIQPTSLKKPDEFEKGFKACWNSIKEELQVLQK